MGDNGIVMTLLLIAVVAPVAFLLLLLGMERVEAPLRTHDIAVELAEFLDAPSHAGVLPDQVESLASEGYGPALERYWRRQRVLALLRREG